MQIESEQLGVLEIPEQSVVHFPLGIPGFPDTRDFCLVEVKPGSRFKLLQCINRASLAFVVTDPLDIDPAYPLDALREQAVRMGLKAGEPIAAAVIVTVSPPPKRPTANLIAPLIMGMESRIGLQVVIQGAQYHYKVRHVL